MEVSEPLISPTNPFQNLADWRMSRRSGIMCFFYFYISFIHLKIKGKGEQNTKGVYITMYIAFILVLVQKWYASSTLCVQGRRENVVSGMTNTQYVKRAIPPKMNICFISG